MKNGRPRSVPDAMTTVERRPRTLPLSHRRAFVQRHTRLRPVDGVADVRLYLADEVEPLWRAVEEAAATDGAPIPFWAFAWAGGLALARYITERPDEVRAKRVLDLGTGSGLVGIAAALTGAEHVTAADIDPFAEAAVALNARANGVRLAFTRRNLLDEEVPADVDVVLAADTWYEGPLAEAVLPWLQAAADRGTRVLIADPGRRYLPEDAHLREIRRYLVRTTTTLEDRPEVASRVFVLDAAAGRAT